MKTVFVLVAKWADNSGFKVVRVYAEKDKAEEAREIVDACEPSMRVEIIEVPYIKGYYE